MARAGWDRSLHDWQHRPSAVLACRTVPPRFPSVQQFSLQSRFFRRTYKPTHTDKQSRSGHFFTDPLEEIADQNTFNAKSLKTLLSTSLCLFCERTSLHDGRPTGMLQQNSFSTIYVIFPFYLSAPMSGTNEGACPPLRVGMPTNMLRQNFCRVISLSF